MTIPVRHKIQNSETVFSWLARLYRLSPAISLKEFTSTYLGLAKVRLHPYLPAHIRKIAKNTNSNSSALILNHTLYPLFVFFGIEKSTRLKKSMLSNQGQIVINHAALPQAKLAFYNGLKFCPLCEREDVARLGFAYYRLEHHIPGVEACWVHGCHLNNLDCGDHGIDRKLPIVPSDTIIRPAPSSALDFSKFANDVLNLAKTQSNPIDYQQAYLNTLSERQLASSSNRNRIKITALKKQMSDYYKDFDFGSKQGMPIELASFKFVGPLLRMKTHYRCHPSKHLLLAFFLFDGDASVFLSQEKNKNPTRSSAVKSNPEYILSLLRKGLSMQEISRSTGRSRCYIRRIAELNNIHHRTNKQRFSKTTRRSVAIKGFLGIHRNHIAEQLRLSTGYVEQVLSNTRGLVAWRKHLRQAPKIRAAINQIVTARKEHKDWLRKDIKRHCQNAFFTLFHFNKELLNSVLPAKQAPNHPYKNWNKEDERILREIKKIENAPSLSRTKLDQLVKGRGALLKRLHKLPKTDTLLRTFINNKEH